MVSAMAPGVEGHRHAFLAAELLIERKRLLVRRLRRAEIASGLIDDTEISVVVRHG
jgi:hypothetical protein